MGLVSSWLTRVTWKGGKKPQTPQIPTLPPSPQAVQDESQMAFGIMQGECDGEESRLVTPVSVEGGDPGEWAQQWASVLQTQPAAWDMNCLMLGLSGVSSLATRLIHNTDKPSAVNGKETLYGKTAIESPVSFLTMFFCNFFRQCCLFWLFSDHWNSQMPWSIKSISKLGIYLFSKLKLFLMSLLKLDRAFIPRNHNIFPVVFSSSF